MYYQGVTAILLHHAVWSPDCDEKAWDAFSIVHYHPLHDRPPVHTVRSAVYRKTIQLAHIMEARGYRKVGQVVMLHTHEIDHPDDSSRLAAALEACYRHRGGWPDPLILLYSLSGDKQCQEIVKYLRSHSCDGIVVPSDFHAQAVLDMRISGKKAKPQIGVAVGLRGEGSPHLSGMMNNSHELTDQAVSLLDQQVRNNQNGLPALPVDVVVPTQWHEGSSLPDRSVR